MHERNPFMLSRCHLLIGEHTIVGIDARIAACGASPDTFAQDLGAIHRSDS